MAKLGRPKTSLDIPCVCGACGKRYTVPDHQRGGRSYCSRDCFFEGMRGKPRVARRVPREKRGCGVCGKEFVVKGRKLDDADWRPAKQQHCSRDCMSIAATTIPLPRELSEGEAGWLGGLFDGEGSLVFYHSNRKSARRISNAYKMTVTNTYYPLIEKLIAVTGTGYVVSSDRGNEKHAKAYQWICSGHIAAAVLRQILPWLIIKRERVEAAIGLREMTEDLRYVRKGKPLPGKRDAQ